MSVDLDRAEQLAAAATPGPWFTEVGGVFNATRSYLVVPTGDSDQDRADAEFIAGARELMPALVARVAVLTEAGNRLAVALEEWDRAAGRADLLDDPAILAAWRALVGES